MIMVKEETCSQQWDIDKLRVLIVIGQISKTVLLRRASSVTKSFTAILFSRQLTASQMQEYGGGTSNKSGEFRDGAERGQDGFPSQQQYGTQKNYGSNRDLSNQNITTYSRVATGIYEVTASQNYENQNTSSPPNSPLIGLVFDPTAPNYSGSNVMTDHINADRRSSWSSHQEPIGTGAKKKIVKSQDKRNAYSADNRYQERYKDTSTETDRPRNRERNLTSVSTSSLDFFTEGERMVSELCNIPDPNSRHDMSNQKSNQKRSLIEEDKNKSTGLSDVLLTALDKIVIHDQIPNQIVQLAIEACTDAENIAIAHHNRPCFKNIHSICAKTRSNVQKPDSAVANLHSQGIPWVIKNFIFSFVRILDGWKGVKELLSEKHDTFSRIENKYYSPNIRECFVQWQAVTKEMLTHIYKTFKCLDHGFTMEQKSFTHNYYATNSAAPRHQNQNKFQPAKAHVTTPRHINASPQPYSVIQPPWIQNQSTSVSQNYSDSPWSARSHVTYKKNPVVPSHCSQNFYPLNEHNEIENFPKGQYKCEPCVIRETKPRQSWTITNVPDFRNVESVCHPDQRDIYTQLKHKMDAELGKPSSQTTMVNMPCDLLQRRDMELKAKMIPLSHVEKTLIPSMASAADMRSCYLQKNNSCGDTKEETEFFAAWGQIVQKESSDFLTHHIHNIQVPSSIVTISNNISGPVQFIDLENDEFHEMSKVYMKPGSYKVPIKPAEPMIPFTQSASQDVVYDSHTDDTSSLKVKDPFSQVTLAPQPKYNIESWPCLMTRRADEILINDQKSLARPSVPGFHMRGIEPLEIITSDRAWEAAKQSAPKLMDFIHEGSKSDTARLYDALGLTANEESTEEPKKSKFNIEQSDAWSAILLSSQFMSKQTSSMWDQTSSNQECMQNKNDDSVDLRDDILKHKPGDEQNSTEIENLADIDASKNDQIKKNPRCPNFDQTGNYVKDENQKKTSGKPKVAVYGTWYHPKKKKPLTSTIVKKFESVIYQLSQLKEAAFIEHDMDIKVAPRFYEVVKYPMCLNDISTKLKNSAYTEYDQVVQDCRRIFNNVRLYLKTYPDIVMKKNVSKVSIEFEKILSEEFANKCDLKNKPCDANKKPVKENETHKAEAQKDEIKKDSIQREKNYK
ncbi:jg17381 [Pararge aegeria aegeria]|uniref:Jg17381 protein n=1 Tax=Pararge aegeria aegeria TaxID=348720 RepID=A0A8S4RWR0_9NEOP|nr:jg17381 [Pararge aegeria aegeria]